MSKHQAENARASFLNEKMDLFQHSFKQGSRKLFGGDQRKHVHPVESVCAVGEVKSNVSLDQLKSSLRELSAVKRCETA